MQMRSTRSHHNPLIRRVQRHSSIASLFRAAASQPSERGAYNHPRLLGKTAGELPLVKAFLPGSGPLFTPEGEVEPAAAPSELRAPHKPAAVAEQYTSPIAEQQPVYNPIQAAPESQPARSQVDSVPRRMEPTANPAMSAVNQEPATEEDRTWKRLQNIFRRHTEKKQGKEMETPARTVEPVRQDKPTALQTKAADTAEQAVQPAEQEHRPVDRVDTPAASTRQPETPIGQKTRLSPSQARLDSKNLPAEIQGQNAAPEAPGAMEVGGVESSPLAMKPETAPDEVIYPTFEAAPTLISTQTAPGRPETPASSANSEIIESDLLIQRQAEEAHPRPQTPDVEPEIEQTEAQELPLEAVWAVQRTQSVEDRAAPTVIGKRMSAAGEESREPAGGVPDPGARAATISTQEAAAYDTVIRQALQYVQPTQASGSGIEYVPPRRPRPAESRPVPEPAAGMTGQGTPESSATIIRRQPITTPDNDGIDEELVQTEIGPLPHDLWQLIGEAPPAGTGSMQAGESVARNAGGVREHQEIHGLQGSKMQVSETPNVPAVHSTQMVQRRAVSSGRAAPARVERTQSAGVQPSDEEGTKEGAEPDIDELARQVYAEVRRRLDLDWERTRRR